MPDFESTCSVAKISILSLALVQSLRLACDWIPAINFQPCSYELRAWRSPELLSILSVTEPVFDDRDFCQNNIMTIGFTNPTSLF